MTYQLPGAPHGEPRRNVRAHPEVRSQRRALVQGVATSFWGDSVELDVGHMYMYMYM